MIYEFLAIFATVLGMEWWLILLLREIDRTTQEGRTA